MNGTLASMFVNKYIATFTCSEAVQKDQQKKSTWIS